MLHVSNLLGVANRVGFQKDFTTEIAEKKTLKKLSGLRALCGGRSLYINWINRIYATV